MNPRGEISLAYALVWTIVGLVLSSDGRPSDVNDSGLTVLPMSHGVNEDNEPAAPSDPRTTVADGKTVGNVPSAVVPQVGFLEERSDVGAIGKDPLPVIVANADGPNASGSGAGQSAGNGLLVPIVSVVDADSSKSSNGIVNHPLVALLPAPSTVEGSGGSKLPEISSLPVMESAPAKPEIRRSVDVESRNNGKDDESFEVMDVAEDIVFRPLFAVRQAAGKSPYTSRYLRRNYRPNYRRYNVNGYYRIPDDNYYRSGDNNNRGGSDYSDEYDKRSN